MKQTSYFGEKTFFSANCFQVLHFYGSRLHRVTLASLPPQHDFDDISFLLFETNLQLFFWFNKKMMRLYMHKFNAVEGEQIPVMSVTDKISLPEMPQGILCDEKNLMLILEFATEVRGTDQIRASHLRQTLKPYGFTIIALLFVQQIFSLYFLRI